MARGLRGFGRGPVAPTGAVAGGRGEGRGFAGKSAGAHGSPFRLGHCDAGHGHTVLMSSRARMLKVEVVVLEEPVAGSCAVSPLTVRLIMPMAMQLFGGARVRMFPPGLDGFFVSLCVRLIYDRGCENAVSI